MSRKKPKPRPGRQRSLGLAELGFALLVQELPAAPPSSSSSAPPSLTAAELRKQLKLW
jgi:hypothetical protein